MTVNIENLTCRFADQIILDRINLSLVERRIGVVGRNGCGKSTLAKAICGLLEPVSGRVSIDGNDILADRKAAIRTVGILFQNPDHQIIFPTAKEEIAFGARQLGLSKRESDKAATGLLSKFNRLDWADRPVSQLSQGQRHLVCLLAVLVMSPSVIVLDEPFSGLDIPTIRRLQKYFKGLEQSIIHITHDPLVISDYDRVLWIEDHKIILDGTPAEVIPTYLAAMENDDARADF